MSDCVQRHITEGSKYLAIISRYPAFLRPQRICHHFGAPTGTTDPEPNEQGVIDLSEPERYDYIRVLLGILDAARFDIEAIGGMWGLEARETLIPDEAWIRDSSELMCHASERSGAIYGGWTWEAPRGSWPGLHPNA
jgi:hypothetical protein